MLISTAITVSPEELEAMTIGTIPDISKLEIVPPYQDDELVEYLDFSKTEVSIYHYRTYTVYVTDSNGETKDRLIELAYNELLKREGKILLRTALDDLVSEDKDFEQETTPSRLYLRYASL